MIEKVYSVLMALLDKAIWIIDVDPSVHRFFLAPNLGRMREFFGNIRAVRLYRHAAQHVPAYKDFIAKHQFTGPQVSIRTVSLGDIPEMDKMSYIKKYSITDKIWNGQLPTQGIMFDESSGSSGTPTSWVRGPKERHVTQRIMQVAFQEIIGKRNPIIINTFSMGAWATGLNTTVSLLSIGRIKSIGPDITKVIDTLKELGPDFDYLISGYPPFLKQVIDNPDINWSQYRITAIYGGEGISEAMRDSLLEKYISVIGSYGASDLEINIAHENTFTIALRRALSEDEELRKKLIRQGHGVIPMIFQYNPYDYLFETNDAGELVATICRLDNLSPRIRYNIHDLGHVQSFHTLKKQLRELGRDDLVQLAQLDFAVLFHYGRSDMSVDYNGATVGPEEIKQIISNNKEYSNYIAQFRLISYEDKQSQKHLLIALELTAEAHTQNKDAQNLLEYIIEQLQLVNLDFKSAYRTAPLKPEIRVYKNNTGIFDTAHQKLKNDYIWNIDYARAQHEEILD
ncbi:MAG: CoF synthetase [Candidatus Buchananbacteria bacterium]|nr:CoF synthetase [Candidatus Buchananbacteria bacterium]